MELISKELLALKISQLIRYGIDNLELDIMDGYYANNHLAELFGITEPVDIPPVFEEDLYNDLLTPIADYALHEGMIDEFGKERFKTKIMGYVMASPSFVLRRFDDIVGKRGIREATSWFYKFCTKSTYINQPLLDTNISWTYEGVKGKLDINVNCARPEKDPKEIALAKAMPQTNYPKCMLCKENLGYPGRINHPARQTLRYIPIPLENDGVWYMQFSPYRYFDQHCIMFDGQHRPMVSGYRSFERMLELLENIPHYFVSSNAPLPIVGGSILSHDHYQAGSKVMPELKSALKLQYFHNDFPGVKFSVLDWYNSVVRVKTKDKDEFIRAVSYINRKWEEYNDEKCNIISHTGDTLHNAITPVFHLERGDCYAELFLRNNRTDEEHPYGIFHPTEDMHFIKKEGIGVIEVMGCFVLPGRLAGIFEQIKDIVYGRTKITKKTLSDANNPLSPYGPLIVKLLTEVDKSDPANVDNAIHDFVSEICEKVLRCTAVFKDNEEGLAGFERFMEYLGCEPYEDLKSGEVDPTTDMMRERERYQREEARQASERQPRQRNQQKAPQYNSQYQEYGQQQYNPDYNYGQYYGQSNSQYQEQYEIIDDSPNRFSSGYRQMQPQNNYYQQSTPQQQGGYYQQGQYQGGYYQQNQQQGGYNQQMQQQGGYNQQQNYNQQGRNQGGYSQQQSGYNQQRQNNNYSGRTYVPNNQNKNNRRPQQNNQYNQRNNGYNRSNYNNNGQNGYNSGYNRSGYQQRPAQNSGYGTQPQSGYNSQSGSGYGNSYGNGYGNSYGSNYGNNEQAKETAPVKPTAPVTPKPEIVIPPIICDEPAQTPVVEKKVETAPQTSPAPETSTEEPPKRRRGRPRKNPL